MEMAVKGLKRYGFIGDANDLMARWITNQERDFFATGYFHEKSSYDSKYNEVNSGLYGKITGGYGWTIGVYLNSLHRLATGE
jgi:neutral trehalase